MAIPDFQSTMRPLLAELEDGQSHDFNDVYSKVVEFFQLTPDEQHEKTKTGSSIMRSRVSWARTFLKKAGLLIQPETRHMQITELGLKALVDCPERIDNRYLKQFESFREFHAPKKKTNSVEIVSSDENEIIDPEEQLEKAYDSLNQTLASDLLEQIKTASPQFFEKLVVDLMIAMGYGGSRQDAGEATQYTNDGGIDGIIKEDALGLDSIYLQAKRYTENTVGRPEIQKFAGALDMNRAKKGVFITTSRFSNDAHEFVTMIEKKIVLIDGERLAELMIEYNLAVTTKQTYAIKAIDSDYFNEE